jgi:hypothetical protein
MKNVVRFGLALMLAIGAAAPLAAQPGGENPEAALRAAHRPFESLMRFREELRLSEQQMARLQSIRTQLEQQNAPLRERLVAQHERWRAERRAQLERMTPEQRRAELRRLRGQPAGQRVPADMQPLVRQMRVNIEEAMHQAQGVLTAEQRLQARRILQRELRASRRPGVRPRGPARRPQARMPGAERRVREAEARAAEAERRAAEAERGDREGRQP